MPTAGGGRIDLAGLAGKIVVLYFYPRDDTPGCTTEALDFTALAPAFAASGAVVIGVSKDGQSSHDKFKAKHGLDLVLASDESTQTAQAYGVWGERSLYGRKYMGVERATFLIDREGLVRKVWRKVKISGHAEAVLNEVKQLTS